MRENKENFSSERLVMETQEQQKSHLNFRYLLSLGSNLGDRDNHIERSLLRLTAFTRLMSRTKNTNTSPLLNPIYDTKNHQDYLNCMLDIASDQEPEVLYSRIVEIENDIGHSRAGKWLPRCIDIDILFFAKNNAADFTECSQLSFVNKAGLQVPHHDFWHRDFLLELSQNELGLEISRLKNRAFPIWTPAHA